MEAIIKFLQKIHFLLIFIALEVISVILLVGSDVRRNSVFNTSANSMIGSLYNFTWKHVAYFNLREENADLMRQLSQIRSRNNTFIMDTAAYRIKNDSLGKPIYRYITGTIVKNSVNRQNNFITVNLGSNNGIRPDMGVVSASGVVGVVVSVSPNYSLVLSVLNRKVGVSSKLKSQSFYGSLTWPGSDYRFARLDEIPNHVPIARGDTVVTSGYSAIFPAGIPVAVIEDFEKNSEDNFYSINVKLLTDLKRVSNVMIIDNTMQQERRELEAQESNFVQ
ncbi:MAG: rod shape-determining protein MreC [Bacteroidales bacterium]|nr:rod shape-determining protein MreC [Bacteroidales bacterium]